MTKRAISLWLCLLLASCSVKYTPTGESRRVSESLDQVSYSVVKLSDPTPHAPNLVLKCSASGTIVKTSSHEFQTRKQISPLLTILAPLAAVGAGVLLYTQGHAVLGRDIGGAAVLASLGMLGYNAFNRGITWRDVGNREPTTFVPTTPFRLRLKGTADSTLVKPDHDGSIWIDLFANARHYPAMKTFIYELSTTEGRKLGEFPVDAAAVIPFTVADVDLNIPVTGISAPDAVAVVIGVGDYQKPGVPPVDYALRDAETMRAYLIQTLGFRPDNIIHLVNPSKADFERVFGTTGEHRGELFNFVKPGVSDVFIYYSGHGAPDIESRSGYFVPADASPDYVRLNGYPLRTFYSNIDLVPSRTTTVVLDACFSGSYDKGVLASGASGITLVPKATEPPARVNVLASCKPDQVASWYPDKHHGLYTYYFLKALQRAGSQSPPRRLTMGELHASVADSVSYIARRQRGRAQTPTFSGSAGTAILSPR